jgi:ABC-type transporter Mla subunit MlaD
MKRSTLLAPLALIVLAGPAAAQQPQQRPADRLEEVVARSGVVEAAEAIAAATQPELERTLEQLTSSLNQLFNRIATDPELRASALRAATGMATVAEALVDEQAKVVQEALKSAADALEEAARRQQQRTEGRQGS